MSDDGEPAFPYAAWEYTGSGGETALAHHAGAVTLRDYFAAAALTGILAHVNGFEPGSGTVSRLAYAYADAMLKERAK